MSFCNLVHKMTYTFVVCPHEIEVKWNIYRCPKWPTIQIQPLSELGPYMLNYFHFAWKDSMFCNVKITHEVKYIKISSSSDFVESCNKNNAKVETIQVNGSWACIHQKPCILKNKDISWHEK